MDTNGIVQKKEWVGKLSIPFFVKKKTARTEKCKKITLKKNKKVLKKHLTSFKKYSIMYIER
jgi:hypothetical protein